MFYFVWDDGTFLTHNQEVAKRHLSWLEGEGIEYQLYEGELDLLHWEQLAR